ncbi:MAG: zinc ribbon domain-containing protein [Ardenticatenaceae bacterium]|nr:zinc ribbon domain-containing protein [Ardenticatenaceae bacterium]
MSNEITCKECGYENPHSSKFCNNCGAKLPLSTHIICPNCATPNTRDRIFCDTCGTRLVAEHPQLKPEEPAESQPINKPFSLPARRPGETGELNPNAVPDWLRTGNIASDKTGRLGESASEEEAAPAPKDTSDLPDWLVHDSDPDPIINAPTTISTEFYKDLLQRAEDLPQPDDLFPDDEGANLPDWLSDAADGGHEAAASQGLTDWLSDLDDSDEGEAETAVPHTVDDEDSASVGLTDWLAELEDDTDTAAEHAAENAAALNELLSAQPNEEADSEDWLTELGPPQTDVFPEPQEDLNVEDLPGWMDELGPIQTNLLDPDQIAELTGPLRGMVDEDEDFFDDDAGEDVSFTDLFETSRGATESLPDWLDAAAEKGESFLLDLPDEPETAVAAEEPEVISEADSDWFTVDEIVSQTDLDWLADTGNLEKAGDEARHELEQMDETADLFEDGLFDDLPDDEPIDAELLADDEDDDFDWLSDMAAIQTGELVIEEAPSEETAVPDLTAEELEEEPEEAEPVAESDSWSSDTFLAETAVGEDLPQWLEQLDEKPETADASELDMTNEEMPDWIASMRPSQGIFGSELPGVLSDVDIRDTLEGIPEELAGAELPEWLQDTPLDSGPAKPFVAIDADSTQEIPDWLQPDTGAAAAAGMPPLPSGEAGPSGSRNEWRFLLEDLPPLTPLAETLPKADIPEWVQQLKPPELTGGAPRDLQGPEETVGPLKGMQGVVAIEPAIARPRTASPLMPYVTTPEQMQQAALLHQIAREMPTTMTTLSDRASYSTAVSLRIGLAVLLFIAVLVGLRGPSLLATGGAVPAHVQAVETAVTAAAGQPVLVAFEYTPAMAGELTPQAEMLLAQLAANNSQVVIASQYAAGTAVAESLTAGSGAQVIGYLPGEGIGLRQLGECIAGRTTCEQLNGRVLPTDLQASLSEIGLVIVVTGDRDNLVNWVEQVGQVAPNVPLVAGVTQALAPLSRSYASTGQITGLLGGAPDVVAYEQLTGQPTSGMSAQLNAQVIGQLLAAVLLIVGLVAYGTTGLVNGRRAQK